MGKRISGIQQVGIGIPDVHKAWKWYRNAFGIDIRMFEEAAEAALMTRYTGGEVHARHAALALHMGGGAGMETVFSMQGYLIETRNKFQLLGWWWM